jgi:hypothetical protein
MKEVKPPIDNYCEEFKDKNEAYEYGLQHGLIFSGIISFIIIILLIIFYETRGL